MRGAVKTVAAHAELLKILPRQPIEIGLWRQRLVEAGIKHRHLPDPGKSCCAEAMPLRLA
jgi:hypothetical protein